MVDNKNMTGMMKARMALASHFGNPTARRMTNYDTRSYHFNSGEIPVGSGEEGNVYVSSYSNLVTPQIQLNSQGNLEFIKDVWSPENDYLSYVLSIKFDRPIDAEYFGNHYKEIAPVMKLNWGKEHIGNYADGGFLSSLQDNERAVINQNKYNNVIPSVRYAEGGNLSPYDLLSLKDRALIIKAGIRNGLSGLEEIKQEYNKFALGGHIYDGETETTLLMNIQMQLEIELRLQEQMMKEEALRQADLFYQRHYNRLEALSYLRHLNQEELHNVLSRLANEGYYDLNANQMSELDIKDVQQRLVERGFLKGNKEIDGIWGNKSKNAWREYQQDGILGERTVDAFMSKMSPELHERLNSIHIPKKEKQKVVLEEKLLVQQLNTQAVQAAVKKDKAAQIDAVLANMLHNTVFDSWNADSAAYNPDYDERFKNTQWGLLNNYLLFDGIERDTAKNATYDNGNRRRRNRLDKRLLINQTRALDKADAEAGRTLIVSDYGCLGSSLDWQGNHAPLWGVPSIRLNMKDFSLNPEYRMRSKQHILGTLWGDYTDKPELYPASWNIARGIAGDELHEKIGKVVNIKDYLNGRKWDSSMYADFPVGTMFNIGDATGDILGHTRYIPKEYGTKVKKGNKTITVDENGNRYPSHTYTIASFTKDAKTGKLIPILNDYGALVVDLNKYVGFAPTYAIIPKGSEHLTAANILPRYKEYKDSFAPIDREKMKMNNQPLAQKTFIDSVSDEELQNLAFLYNIREDLTPIILRVMAIGALETLLDYTIEGNDYSILKNPKKLKNYGVYNILSVLPDFVVGFSKDILRDSTPLFNINIEEKQEKKNAEADTKPAYVREMEAYEDLRSSGALDGKSKEEIQLIVADEYNKRKEAFGILKGLSGDDNMFGKLPSNLKTASKENYKVSRGAFQMKPAKDFYLLDEHGNNISSSRNNVDDRYKGDNESMKAINRFMASYKLLRKKYPDLSHELLIDLTTVSWNSGLKPNDPRFVEFYIKNQTLNDDYLSKVKKHQDFLFSSTNVEVPTEESTIIAANSNYSTYSDSVSNYFSSFS